MVTDRPLFSIIIPTYNRPAQLAACLQMLARLDYPRDRFEVIVVDDGSQRVPAPIVSAFRNQIDVCLLRQAHAGPATARNTGAARAKGTFLAFTDDDCQPASDWLHALAAGFAQGSNCAIGGRTINGLPRNVHSTASQLLIDYLYTYDNATPKTPDFFAANNLAVPASGFFTVGGFDPSFPRAAAEDREFCDRWLCQGYRLTYAAQVVVYHTHPLSIRTFWRQHFNYGRGAFHFHRARIRRGHTRVKPKSFSFYLNLLRYPFGPAHGKKAAVLAALLAETQVANLAGFLWERAFGSNQNGGRSSAIPTVMPKLDHYGPIREALGDAPARAVKHGSSPDEP